MELNNYHFNAFITEDNDLQDLPIIDELEEILDNNIIVNIISFILILISLYFICFII
jgi:hypothetical protein